MLRLVGRTAGVILAIALAGCAPFGSRESDGGLGLRHAYWRTDDRILVSDFSTVSAVDAGQRFVFAGTENGVLVFDHRFRRWEAPLTIEDGFPRADLPIALEVDPIGGVLWLAMRTGSLWAHDISLSNELRRVGVLPGGGPVDLVAWEGSLWAQTGSGWFESGAGGGPPIRARPPAEVQRRAVSGLEQLERESGGFRAAGSSLTVDEWLRRWDITSAAPSSDPSDWFLGTWGGGLYEYDDRMLDARQMPYGTVGRGVSAIAEAAGGGGFWFGGDGMGRRRGVAWSDRALQRWSWFESGRQGAPAGPVYALLDTDLGVFAAAEDGLYRQDGDRWDRLTDFDALQSPTVRSLAWGAGALWAGTDRGLARITLVGTGLGAQPVDGTDGARINALVPRDSLLWIASDRGLWSLHLRTGELAQPPLDDARLRGRIVGLAYDSPTLYALTPTALLAFDGSRWAALPPPASLAGVGRPTHLAAREGVVWISGSAGALGFDPLTGAATLLSVPRDIPEGPVRQSLPVDGGVWFATPAGGLLVRFE